MDDYDDDEFEDTGPGLRAIQLSWRTPVASVLECLSDIFGAFGGLFRNLSLAVLCHQLHVEEQVEIHSQAAQELETLIKGE